MHPQKLELYYKIFAIEAIIIICLIALGIMDYGSNQSNLFIATIIFIEILICGFTNKSVRKAHSTMQNRWGKYLITFMSILGIYYVIAYLTYWIFEFKIYY